MPMVSLLKNEILFSILLKNKHYYQEETVRGGYERKYTRVETTLCDVNSK